jgi:NAD(P)H-hydrate epimerase
MGFVRSTASSAAEEEVKLPPMVIDADGLKLLARLVDWQSKLPNQTILTPHPGEMAVISGLSKDEIQADRINIAARFAKEWGHILVLKGAFTIIADPDGKIAVIPVATPALARAGTGDVLAGLIVGLRAQGVDAFQAAMAGAWIHAQAGLLAAQQLGNTASVLAGDVLRAVPQVLSKLY